MIEIQAAGMSSCLGGVIGACAALRAGIQRIRGSAEVSTFLPGEEAPSAVPVCELPGATFGFEGVGRLVAITCETLTDLGSQVPLERLGSECGLFLAVPDFREEGAAVEATPRAAAARATRLGQLVMGRALENLGVFWPMSSCRFFAGGHAGFALALAAATQALENGPWRHCLVGALDTLVEASHLRSLLEARRLKTSDNPVGFIPGEAGALLLLQARTARAPSSTEPLVCVEGLSIGFEQSHQDSGKRPDGQAMARCIEQALGTGTPAAFVVDLNGEEFRAWEWGCVQVLLKGRGLLNAPPRVWCPAEGLGDVGVASGAVGACVAMRALRRGYSPTRHVVVLSHAETGERAAFVVSTPPRASGRGGTRHGR